MMSKLSDHYPVGMHPCDENVLAGLCGENCPLLESEEYMRFREECYPYQTYLGVKNKSDMSAIKHLEVEVG